MPASTEWSSKPVTTTPRCERRPRGWKSSCSITLSGVVASLREAATQSKGPYSASAAGAFIPSGFRRWWRSELRDICKAKRRLYAANRLFRVFESIFSEHLVLDVFKLVGKLIQLFVREVRFPRWKHDCVFPGCVVFIHSNEALQHA